MRPFIIFWRDMLHTKRILISHNPRTGEKVYATLRWMNLGTDVVKIEHIPGKQ
jgi:hypothetical protein